MGEYRDDHLDQISYTKSFTSSTTDSNRPGWVSGPVDTNHVPGNWSTPLTRRA